jgi:hypothetical protein
LDKQISQQEICQSVELIAAVQAWFRLHWHGGSKIVI